MKEEVREELGLAVMGLYRREFGGLTLLWDRDRWQCRLLRNGRVVLDVHACRADSQKLRDIARALCCLADQLEREGPNGPTARVCAAAEVC